MQNSTPDIQVDGESVYINHSRIRDYLACQELYHLSWEFQGGLAQKAVELPLATGSAYHEGVSHYYHHNRDIPGAILRAFEVHDEKRDDARPMAEELALWTNDRCTVELLIKTYHQKYKNEPLQVLMPEASGTVRLGKSPHYLVFRTDAVYQEYNTVGLLEFKTKARTPSGLEVSRIHSDLQPTTYIYGVRGITGLPVQGVKYRWAIKKPQYELNRLHLEEFTSRTDADLQRFEDEAIVVCEEILRKRKEGGWLHNWNQCTVFGECRKRRLCLHHRDKAVVDLYRRRLVDYVDAAEDPTKKAEY